MIGNRLCMTECVAHRPDVIAPPVSVFEMQGAGVFFYSATPSSVYVLFIEHGSHLSWGIFLVRGKLLQLKRR